MKSDCNHAVSRAIKQPLWLIRLTAVTTGSVITIWREGISPSSQLLSHALLCRAAHYWLTRTVISQLARPGFTPSITANSVVFLHTLRRTPLACVTFTPTPDSWLPWQAVLPTQWWPTVDRSLSLGRSWDESNECKSAHHTVTVRCLTETITTGFAKLRIYGSENNCKSLQRTWSFSESKSKDGNRTSNLFFMFYAQ